VNLARRYQNGLKIAQDSPLTFGHDTLALDYLNEAFLHKRHAVEQNQSLNQQAHLHAIWQTAWNSSSAASASK